MSILKSLSTLAEEPKSYAVEYRYRPMTGEKYLPKDYRPVLLAGRAPREGSRALCHGGGQANTVIHAQSDRSQDLGRMHREKGELLCGQKQGKRSFERYAKDGQDVTCDRCQSIIQKYGLSSGTLITFIR